MRGEGVSACTSYGEAFVESADSGGNIRVCSEIVGYCYVISYVKDHSVERQASSHLRPCFSFAPAARSSVPRLKERSLYTFCSLPENCAGSTAQ